jgi:hypothetical protein
MEVTVITSVGWVSRRKLEALTLSRAPGPAPRPRPLSDLSPPSPHHPTPIAHRLLHAAASSVAGASPSSSTPRHSCRPRVLPPTPFTLSLSLSLSLSRTQASHARRCRLVGARGQPRRRLRPGSLPARHRPVSARPLHCFLGHRRLTSLTAARPGSASPRPRPVGLGRCRSPPLAAPPPDSLHRPSPNAAHLP